MKKVLIAAAAAGLMSLAACTPPASNTVEPVANDTANAAIYDDTANLIVENGTVENIVEGNTAEANAM